MIRDRLRRVARAVVGEKGFAGLRALWWPVKLRFSGYEPETRALPSLVPRGGVCIDAGGNFGQFASYLARAVGADGFVHIFEPLAYNREIAARVLRRMGLRNVAIHPFAAGSSRGTVHIAIDGGNVGEAHVAPEGEQAEVISLDEWARATELPRVDFVKIDVEGYEMEVLRGAEGLIARFRPAILCEITGIAQERYGADAAGPFRYLEALGYRAHVWRNGRLNPVDAPTPGVINYIFTVSR